MPTNKLGCRHDKKQDVAHDMVQWNCTPDQLGIVWLLLILLHIALYLILPTPNHGYDQISHLLLLGSSGHVETEAARKLQLKTIGK